MVYSLATILLYALRMFDIHWQLVDIVLAICSVGWQTEFQKSHGAECRRFSSLSFSLALYPPVFLLNLGSAFVRLYPLFYLTHTNQNRKPPGMQAIPSGTTTTATTIYRLLSATCFPGIANNKRIVLRKVFFFLVSLRILPAICWNLTFMKMELVYFAYLSIKN